jgi:hypothetical protein
LLFFFKLKYNLSDMGIYYNNIYMLNLHQKDDLKWHTETRLDPRVTFRYF